MTAPRDETEPLPIEEALAFVNVCHNRLAERFGEGDNRFDRLKATLRQLSAPHPVPAPIGEPSEGIPERRALLFGLIGIELDRAYEKHGRDLWGRHEFYGVLREEVDELWDVIKSDGPQSALEDELRQVAAMCFRYFETGDRYRAQFTPSARPETEGETR